MSSNFTLNDYTITTTLKEDLLFIRVTNGVSYQSYENNISLNDINLPFEKRLKYEMIVSCFSKKEKYNVIFNVKQNALEMAFIAILEDVFTINFTIVLPEKRQTDENSLILRMNQMEIENKKTIDEIYIKNCNYQQQLGECNQLIDRMNRDMKFMDISFQKRLSDFNELIEKMNIEHKNAIEKMESKIDVIKSEFETMKIDYEERLCESEKLLELYDNEIHKNNNKISELERIVEGFGHISFNIGEQNYNYLNKEDLEIDHGQNIYKINAFFKLHTLRIGNVHCNNIFNCSDFKNNTVKKLVLYGCNDFAFKTLDYLTILEEIELVEFGQINNYTDVENRLNSQLHLKKIILKYIHSNYSSLKEYFTKYCKNRGIECEIY